MDDQELSALFPCKDLEEYRYFLDYERRFEWYTDRAYSQYAGFQDYQRLVLLNINDTYYENWELEKSEISRVSPTPS
jgi:hypothetical protein